MMTLVAQSVLVAHGTIRQTLFLGSFVCPVTGSIGVRAPLPVALSDLHGASLGAYCHTGRPASWAARGPRGPRRWPRSRSALGCWAFCTQQSCAGRCASAVADASWDSVSQAGAAPGAPPHGPPGKLGGAGAPGGPPLAAQPDRFGLLGLLGVIRMTDPDLTTLALGTDLTTLGLHLNSPENVYKTFASPWADTPLRPEPDFKVAPGDSSSCMGPRGAAHACEGLLGLEFRVWVHCPALYKTRRCAPSPTSGWHPRHTLSASPRNMEDCLLPHVGPPPQVRSVPDFHRLRRCSACTRVSVRTETCFGRTKLCYCRPCEHHASPRRCRRAT